MTLNIMATSRTHVYLSGDFRLTRTSGGRIPDDLRVQKLIPACGFDWHALIAFTGVAVTPHGTRVGDWIAAQAAKLDNRSRLSDLLKNLSKAERWLSHVPLAHRGLTMSVVGYARRRPFAALVSNIHEIESSTPNPIGRLRTTSVKPKEPRLLFFGDTRGITRADAAELSALLGDMANPDAAHPALSRFNAQIAKTSVTVSPECVTGHLTVAGAGEIRPNLTKDPPGEYLPDFVRRDLTAAGISELMVKTGDDGRPLPPRWLRMTLRVDAKLRVVLKIHAFRNVREAIGSSPEGTVVFSKIAGPDEPRTVEVRITR